MIEKIHLTSMLVMFTCIIAAPIINRVFDSYDTKSAEITIAIWTVLSVLSFSTAFVATIWRIWQ